MAELAQWAKTLWGLWLMLIFIGIVAYVMWPSRKREMAEHARIPLDDPLDDQLGDQLDDPLDDSERKRHGREE